jgi:hypothetical protein
MADKDDNVNTHMANFLSMPDEEIRNMVSPGVADPAPELDADPVDNEPVVDLALDANDDQDKDPVEGDDDEPADKPGEEESSERDGNKEGAADSQDKAPAADQADKAAEPADKPAAEQGAVDFESEYRRLLAPFKANGREIKVNSVDEAVTLMQMGANYNKKMAALKPNLKLMKLLENNGLLNEEKIGFLIDLGRKDPAAINKLVKDSGIDPMDLSAEQASAYKQTAYTVDDREIELDTVLDDIQGTPSYNRTLEVVSTKWDAASKQVIAGTPQLLKVINDHISNGIYDVISKEIESERMFGRLNGVSDIEAYRRIGDSLHAKGAFNHLVQGSSPTQAKPAAQPVVVTPKPKVEDDKLKDKRRAASSTKPAATGNSTPSEFDPLALSDDEFSKLINKNLL